MILLRQSSLNLYIKIHNHGCYLHLEQRLKKMEKKEGDSSTHITLTINVEETRTGVQSIVKIIIVVASSFNWVIIIFNIPTKILLFFCSTQSLPQFSPIRTPTLSHFLLFNAAKILNLIPPKIFFIRHRRLA